MQTRKRSTSRKQLTNILELVLSVSPLPAFSCTQLNNLYKHGQNCPRTLRLWAFQFPEKWQGVKERQYRHGNGNVELGT